MSAINTGESGPDPDHVTRVTVAFFQDCLREIARIDEALATADDKARVFLEDERAIAVAKLRVSDAELSALARRRPDLEFSIQGYEQTKNQAIEDRFSGFSKQTAEKSPSEPTKRAALTSERVREIAERGQQKAKERERLAREQARERKKQSLLSDKQLTLWVDAVRGAPNEIVRSALFTAKNRKQAREDLKRAVVAVVGDGQITYTGEELRQDDETVWLQLIHLARENGLSTAFQFTPYSFCKAINWPINGQSFDRLDKCMTRLQATSLKIASERLGDEVSLSMLPGYKAKRRKDGDGGLWTVRMHDELVFLFSEFQYTRVEWQQRLALPEGLATWLHAYYASHREPFAVKVETLAVGAGLMTEAPEDAQLDAASQDARRKERLREVKKLIVKALEALKETGFLMDFEVTRSGLVNVRRSTDERPIL